MSSARVNRYRARPVRNAIKSVERSRRKVRNNRIGENRYRRSHICEWLVIFEQSVHTASIRSPSTDSESASDLVVRQSKLGRLRPCHNPTLQCCQLIYLGIKIHTDRMPSAPADFDSSVQWAPRCRRSRLEPWVRTISVWASGPEGLGFGSRPVGGLRPFRSRSVRACPSTRDRRACRGDNRLRPYLGSCPAPASS